MGAVHMSVTPAQGLHKSVTPTQGLQMSVMAVTPRRGLLLARMNFRRILMVLAVASMPLVQSMEGDDTDDAPGGVIAELLQATIDNAIAIADADKQAVMDKAMGEWGGTLHQIYEAAEKRLHDSLTDISASRPTGRPKRSHARWQKLPKKRLLPRK